MRAVRDQQERDEQTVAIGTALGIFALVLTGVGLFAWFLHAFSDVLDGQEGVITGTAVVVAGIAACAYLMSQRA